jgi:hypothetical protein
MTQWRISATPVEGGADDAILLGAATDTSVGQAWVPAPDAGDWVVEVSVTFDRDRGHLDGYGRLEVAPTPPG